MIDCNPLSLSKVMRIRKRLGWSMRDQKKKVLEQRSTALRFPRVIACLMRGLWAYRLRDGRAGVRGVLMGTTVVGITNRVSSKN